MTARTVTSTLRAPNGTAQVGASVVVELVAGPNDTAGWVSGGAVHVSWSTTLTTDAQGLWTASLEPNSGSGITVPAGTVYRITEKITGTEPRIYHISVPDTVGPHDAGDLLVSAPTDLTSWVSAAVLAAGYQPLDADLTALAAISGVQGDVIYHNGTSWVRLAAGSSGQFLKTLGAAANPAWATLPGGGDLLAANNLSDVANAATARTNLGLAIGTNVQAYDSDLAAIAALTSAADKVAYATGAGTWALADLTAAGRALLDDANAAAQRTTLGLAIGTDVQAQDAELSAIAGLTSAADKVPYFTGSGTASTADFTAAGRALVDDADASAQRTTLGLGTIATQAANSVSITGGSVTGITDLAVADGGTGASTAADARTNLGLVIGTNVQAQDAELTAIAGLTSAADSLPYFTGSGTAALATFTTAGRALVDDADAAAQRTTLGLGTAAVATLGAASGNALAVNTVDAKGDLIAATAADAVARLAVGTNDTALVADSTQATGLRYGGALTVPGTLTAQGSVAHTGSTVGFYSATPATKPTVSGKRMFNPALADALAELATLGLVTNSSTAGQPPAFQAFTWTFSSPTQTALTSSSVVYASGTVTITTPSHAFNIGRKVTLAGYTPSGWNGDYTILTTPSSTTFTVAKLNDPGAVSVHGTCTMTGTTYTTQDFLFNDTAYNVAFSANTLSVDATNTYTIAALMRGGDDFDNFFNSGNIAYVGIEPLDIDGNLIYGSMCRIHSGAAQTTLAADLNPSDNTVQLTSASGWKNDSSTYSKHFAWYPYRDSRGTQYPNYTYSRNETAISTYFNNVNGGWAAGGISGNTITLSSAWGGPFLPAGTPIANVPSDAGTYQYVLNAGALSNAWTSYTATLNGYSSPTTADNDATAFRYGTAKLRLAFLSNYHGTANNRSQIRSAGIVRY